MKLTDLLHPLSKLRTRRDVHLLIYVTTWSCARLPSFVTNGKKSARS
jgi:hypothetical protein